MQVLVVGSGGREHALAWRLAQSPSVTKVFVTPGNAGIASVAVCVPCGPSPLEYLALAKSLAVDLTVVGPEAPLVDGIVDAFLAENKLIVGPTAAAAQMEGSKSFSKQVMAEGGVPTARFVEVSTSADALAALAQFTYPVVIKADGLAAGKGVVIAQTPPEAIETIHQFLGGSLGDAGKKLVIEEFLTGEEVSFIVLTDGKSVLPTEPAQDHKTIFDGDLGPNTGGMGAYCDSRILTADQRTLVINKIIQPTLDVLRHRGTPFAGFLFAGLMMTSEGPKTLEFNCRFGDPETQPILYRMEGDLGEVLLALAQQRLHEVKLAWNPDPSICVVLAAHGYPAKVRTGDAITGFDLAEAAGAKVFHAGTKQSGGQIVTAGGRVLGVTTGGSTLQAAVDQCYQAADHMHFDGMQMRRDIGQKGLKRW